MGEDVGGCSLYRISVMKSVSHQFPTVTDPSNRSDDGAFDIITEEEVNGVYDSDATSQTTGGSLEGEQDRRPPGSLDV